MRKSLLLVVQLLTLSFMFPTTALAGVSLKSLAPVQSSGIFGLFLLMMGIGLAGFTGHNRRRNT